MLKFCPKHGLGYILGDYFMNKSGHPATYMYVYNIFIITKAVEPKTPFLIRVPALFAYKKEI
jgi:hypothetical protein